MSISGAVVQRTRRHALGSRYTRSYTRQMSPDPEFTKVKAIITGATGMVGEGVLLECLSHPDVEQVLVINRRPGGVSHPKLREIIRTDFFDLAPIEPQLIE